MTDPDRRQGHERRHGDMERSLAAVGLPDRRQRQRRQPPPNPPARPGTDPLTGKPHGKMRQDPLTGKWYEA